MLALSCSKQEGEPQPPVDTTPVPLQVSVGVQAATTRSVITGTAFPHGEAINIILNDAGGTTSYNGIELPYRFTKPSDGAAGVWMPVLPDGQTEGLMMKSEAATLLAHYPATLPTGASVNKPTATLTPAVAAEQDFGTPANGNYRSYRLRVNSTAAPAATEDVYLSQSEVDYLTGSVASVTNSSGTVSIPMKHLLAMVVLRVDKNPADDASLCEMKYMTLTNKAGASTPMTDGTFSILDGSFSVGSTAQTYRRTMDGFAAGTNFGMLVYPATIATAGDVVLEFRVDYQRYTIDMPAKEWTPGSVTLYKVKIEGNQAILDKTIHIKEWPTVDDHILPLD